MMNLINESRANTLFLVALSVVAALPLEGQPFRHTSEPSEPTHQYLAGEAWQLLRAQSETTAEMRAAFDRYIGPKIQNWCSYRNEENKFTVLYGGYPSHLPAASCSPESPPWFLLPYASYLTSEWLDYDDNGPLTVGTSGDDIVEGSQEEDQYDPTTDEYFDSIPLDLNFFNHHFCEPDNFNQGLFNDGLFGSESAPTRANDHWSEAVEHFRAGDEAQAFYYLGRITHLLEDLSSIPHTHLDPHPQADAFEDYFGRKDADWDGSTVTGETAPATLGFDNNFSQWTWNSVRQLPLYLSVVDPNAISPKILDEWFGSRFQHREYSDTWPAWAFGNSTPDQTAAWRDFYGRTELFRLFYSMAETADDFPSDDRVGDDDALDDLVSLGSIPEENVRQFADVIMPAAISHVAALYRLFWERCGAINDDLIEVRTLGGLMGSVETNNECATAEPDEPDHGGMPADRSLWWQWTAPADGTLEIRVEGAASTALAVYTGSSLGNLDLIAETAAVFDPRLSLDVTEGVNYRITSDSTEGGTFALLWGFSHETVSARPIPNDGNENFTMSVALSGTHLVVGDDFVDHLGVRDSGAVYAFERSPLGDWPLLGRIGNPEPGLDDEFGWSAAISGDTLLVGVPFDDGTQGSAYAFRKRGLGWDLEQKLTATDSSEVDLFGINLDVDGDFAVASFRGEEPEHSGAYVFRRIGLSWLQIGKLVVPNSPFIARYEPGVAIAGNTIALYSNNGIFVYAIEISSNTVFLSQQIVISSELNPDFGGSVSIEDDLLVAGAPSDDDGASNSGAIYIYRRVNSGGQWTLDSKLKNELPVENSFLGGLVAINRRVIAASGGESVAVFQRRASEWTKVLSVMPVGATATDFAYTFDFSDYTLAASKYIAIPRSTEVLVFDLGATIKPIVRLDSPPSRSETIRSGDLILVRWTSERLNPDDTMVISLKRDSVPPEQTEPDGVNWVRVAVGTPNDGLELVAAPTSLASADDWRVYVREEVSDVFDSSDVTFTVAPRTIELFSTVTQRPASLTAGGSPGLVQVGIYNAGPAEAQTLSLSTTASVNGIVLATTGCQNDPSGFPTCQLPSLAAGQGMTVSIEVAASPSASGSLDLGFCSNSPGALPGTDCTSASIGVTRSAALSVDLAPLPALTRLGTQIEQRFTLMNSGPSSGTSVSVLFTLSGGLSPVIVEPPNLCSLKGTTLQCEFGTLAPNSEAAGRIVLNAEQLGLQQVTAVVSGAELDPDTGNNSDLSATLVVEPGIFQDGFESSDLSGWSFHVP